MTNARIAIVVVSFLVMIGTGVWVYQSGLTFQAAGGSQPGQTTAPCDPGYVWNGSSCVLGGSGTSSPSSTPGDGSTPTPSASSGTSGSSSNTDSSGTSSSGSSGSSNKGATPTAMPAAGSQSQASAIEAARVYKYQLSGGPFAELAKGGFTEIEMSWIGSEVLRSMMRAEQQGRHELTKTDLTWIVQLIIDSRAAIQ